MRWADRPRSSLAWMVARHGSQSLGRPGAGGPWHAVAGGIAGSALLDEVVAVDGFGLPYASGEPVGAMAGFAGAGTRRRWRATVSRLRPNSGAMRRWDQPRCHRDRMVSIMATLSRFDMADLAKR